MAVLTNIPNNTSARDWRDTMNSLIKRVAALEAAGVPVETPAPAFTTQPSISPTNGTAGSTVYAATPGTVSNGAVVSRAWLLNGTAISTGVTALPASSGTLAYQETASGPGGTTTSTVQVAAVIAMRKSAYDSGESTVIVFSADVPTGTQGTVTFAVPGGAVRAGLDSVCTVNAATAPVDVQTVELINASTSTLSLSTSRVQNGILLGIAHYSTTGSTFHSTAIEVPSASASGTAVTFANNSSATPTWTGIGNPDAGLLTEATGSQGTVVLVLSFSPAS